MGTLRIAALFSFVNFDPSYAIFDMPFLLKINNMLCSIRW
jgi:hypothetical protein